MDNINTNKLKRIMIIVGILIVLIVIVILVIKLNAKQEEIDKEIEILEKGNIAPTISYKKEKVKEHSRFFSVENAIQSYLSAISLDTTQIGPKPIRGSSMRTAEAIYAEDHGIKGEKDKNKVVFNYLDETYKNENNITEENVMEKIANNGKLKFEALEMYEVIGKNIMQFSVYGKETQEETQKFRYVYFVVNVDNKNNTFSVKPIESGKYKCLEEVPLNSEDKSIENKETNYYNFNSLQNMDIAQKYFTYYKKMMLQDSAKAYEMLNEEYRNKRFGSIEEFQKYIENNKEDIKTYTAKEFAVNNYEKTTEYICMDKYKNQYLFNVSSVMDFDVKLDTYTIEDEEVKERYKTAKDEDKVKMNIDKWILMLNNRDYKAAYEVLDEEFRNEYFQNVDKFEKYMRTTFPLRYGLTFTDFKQEAGVFIQDILLTDIVSNDKSITQETIIMKLTEDGFKMSFRILSH